jgi:4,5-DOPA dioxygenase extradiol
MQLSMKDNLSNENHIRLGEVLAPLRSEGTLIICSGQITHNLSAFGQGKGLDDPRTVEFMTWVRTTLQGTTSETYLQTRTKFVDIERQAPQFDFAHPPGQTEHLTPLFIALGTMKPQNVNLDETCSDVSARSLYKEVNLGSLGLEHYIFN